MRAYDLSRNEHRTTTITKEHCRRRSTQTWSLKSSIESRRKLIWYWSVSNFRTLTPNIPYHQVKFLIFVLFLFVSKNNFKWKNSFIQTPCWHIMYMTLIFLRWRDNGLGNNFQNCYDIIESYSIIEFLTVLIVNV